MSSSLTAAVARHARAILLGVAWGALLTGLLQSAPAGDPPPRPAPKLPETGWLNTPGGKPLGLEDLRGKVVLVEFWTYACWNCRNVEPYVKSWHEKYAKDGLVVIGVHTPELEYERKPENVKKYITERKIRYPVVLDSDYVAWNRFQNEYWPTLYLLDAEGRIVYTAVGEGNYDRTEARLRELLAQVRR
jgi:thiol-disulfide isomerase/thioredoxin